MQKLMHRSLRATSWALPPCNKKEQARDKAMYLRRIETIQGSNPDNHHKDNDPSYDDFHL